MSAKNPFEELAELLIADSEGRLSGNSLLPPAIEADPILPTLPQKNTLTSPLPRRGAAKKDSIVSIRAFHKPAGPELELAALFVSFDGKEECQYPNNAALVLIDDLKEKGALGDIEIQSHIRPSGVVSKFRATPPHIQKIFNAANSQDKKLFELEAMLEIANLYHKQWKSILPLIAGSPLKPLLSTITCQAEESGQIVAMQREYLRCAQLMNRSKTTMDEVKKDVAPEAFVMFQVASEKLGNAPTF